MKLANVVAIASMVVTFVEGLSFSDVSELRPAMPTLISPQTTRTASKVDRLLTLIIKLESPATRHPAKIGSKDGSDSLPGTMATAFAWETRNKKCDVQTLRSVDAEIVSDEQCNKLFRDFVAEIPKPDGSDLGDWMGETEVLDIKVKLRVTQSARLAISAEPNFGSGIGTRTRTHEHFVKKCIEVGLTEYRYSRSAFDRPLNTSSSKHRVVRLYL
ncbi:unnamed protein product [Phytophthora lilii]|uniref:Unnamed protein product n=1 Tax=Phytophthora lilii TaxID=2077276 RepID=A0A9W6UEA3_9STRA|nr:unnamed protein product [Phytophthora lilii]